MTGSRMPAAFWALWTGFLANRLGLLAPAFLTLYLTSQGVATAGETGLTIAAYGGGAIGGGLLGGVIADRLGPRRTLWTSQALASATGLAMMAVRAPPLVMALALAMGTLNGFARSAGYGLAAHLTAPEQRAGAYGRLYWATSIGSAVTAVVSGALLQLWPPAVFLPGAVGAAAYAAIVLALPEVPRSGPREARAGLLADVSRPFRAPYVGPFLALSFVISCVYAQRHSAMPLEMHRNGLSYGQLGLLLSFGALLVVAVQPFAGHATGRRRPGRVFALSAALIAAGFGLNLVAASPAAYAVVIAVWTCGEILKAPLAPTFIAAHAPDGHGSAFQGAYAFVWTLGFAVGAPAGHLLLTAAGPAPLWWGTLAVGLAVAAGHLGLARRCRWLAAPGGFSLVSDRTAVP